MKVTITKKTELTNPRLELTVFLESGQTRVELKHTCSSCGGYGCQGGRCDDTIHLQPEQVLDTVGPEGMAILAQAFGKVLGTHKASGELQEWLVNPPLKLDSWHDNLEGLANSLKGDLQIVNYIGGSTALVEATQVVADTLRQAGYSVNANEKKHAISR